LSGLGQIDGSVWLPYVCFCLVGVQSGQTKVVEGIGSYAYLKYKYNGLSLIYFLLLLTVIGAHGSIIG
jgi:hypothetical protein